MSDSIRYLTNDASEAVIAEHLSQCDVDFVPPLSTRVEIGAYSRKIASKATRFEAWAGDRMVGLVAAYCNDQQTRCAYITSVSVLREWAGKGIAAHLLKRCIEHAKASNMCRISLEVASGNISAIELYRKRGFVLGRANTPFVTMHLSI